MPSYIPSILSAPALAFSVSLAVVYAVLRTGLAYRLALDEPNHRSLHGSPVPRTGGLCMIAGVALAWAAGQAPPAAVWVGAALLAAVSFLDDLFGLPVTVRFLTHALTAAVAGAILLPGAGLAALALAALGTVWLTNLYNFMDGSDGLAGGMAMIGFGGYGVAAWSGGDSSLAAVCLSVAAGAAAFLVYNFHPARIFMGDAGSIPLGFLAAALGLHGWRQGLWSLWFPLLIFSPFVVDASMTLARRLVRREKVWQAHREHYYQRLVRMKWGHRKTALVEYVVMTAAAVSGLWGLSQPTASQYALVMSWCVLYVVLMILIDRRWVRLHAAPRHQ